MSDPSEKISKKRICRSCNRDDLDINDAGPCRYCGSKDTWIQHELAINTGGTGHIGGEIIHGRWIEDRRYQALLVALIVIPLIFSIIMSNWIPIVIGVVADIIGLAIGDRAKHMEKTRERF